MKEYNRLIRNTAEYQQLLQFIKDGKKICIFEIDVPAVGKRGYYGQNINPDGTYDITNERLDKLLYDDKAPFGHGLCIAKALIEDSQMH